MKKVAINGFGRIGRVLARIILRNEHFKLVAINDIYDIPMMVYLFQHDSVYGNLKDKISLTKNNNLKINDSIIRLTSCASIKKLNWKEVDILFECSGVYSKKDELSVHLKNGAKKVVLCAYSKELPMFIIGANEKDYNHENIISGCSCTANCVVPVLDIIDKFFGIEKCNITTIHSYTSEQNLLDNKNADIRRSRSATQNIIPLASNVANASLAFLPHLKDKIYANSIRVPVENGVLIDLHIKLSENSDIYHIKDILHKNIDKRVVSISNDFIVSRDIKGSSYSAIIDESSIQLAQNNFLQIMLWQDNEYGYAQRIIDLAKIIGEEA
jgi:glyceraldehyde 3-phosphate dehydrogenase